MPHRTKPPAIGAFAVDPPTNRYRCSGCGGIDITVWTKDNVDHYVQKSDGSWGVCGRFALANKPAARVPE